MKVFLSSTYSDLTIHRRAVTNALERLGQRVGRMEVFGARPAEPLAACVEEITGCDIFVGVYAHRYGHVPPESSVSIVEQEFLRARELRKPAFCYIVGDECDWPPPLFEGGRAGRSSARSSRVCARPSSSMISVSLLTWP